MATSDGSDKSSCEPRNISIEEFEKEALFKFYNLKINQDLILISNRKLHYKAVHEEFLKFSRFVMDPIHDNKFEAFLTPMFLHLYLLLFSHKGKSDARQFFRAYKDLPFTPKVLDCLSRCKTLEEVQELALSLHRTKVRLTRNDYHKLMDWIKSGFSRFSEMFHILRVLHENFHPDIIDDVNDKELNPMEQKISEANKKWLSDYKAQQAQKSKTKVTAETSKTTESNVENAEDKIRAEKSDLHADEVLKESESFFEIGGSMFKLRESAKEIVDKMKESKNLDEIEEALMNPSWSNDYVSSVDDLEGLDNVQQTDQEMENVAGNAEGSIQAEENAQQDQVVKNVTKNGVKIKQQVYEYKGSNGTNFFAANSVTVSGKNCICSSDISEDLCYMALGFKSFKICVWQTVRDEETSLELICTLRGHEAPVSALVIDSKMKTVISGSHDCTVRVWNIEEGACMTVLTMHSAPVNDVCVSPNSLCFLSASEDTQICLNWYHNTYPMRVFSGHSLQASNCVRFHPNGLYFASASSDGNIFLFQINLNCRPVRLFHKHVNKVSALTFSPCGKHVASADIDGTIIVWDLLKCEVIKTLNTNQEIQSVSYDTTGVFVAAIYFQSWRIYNIEESKEAVIAVKTAGVPKSLRFSKRNELFIFQYVEASKKKILMTKDKPKFSVTAVN